MSGQNGQEVIYYRRGMSLDGVPVQPEIKVYKREEIYVVAWGRGNSGHSPGFGGEEIVPFSFIRNNDYAAFCKRYSFLNSFLTDSNFWYPEKMSVLWELLLRDQKSVSADEE